MDPAEYTLRRATVDDLVGLKLLWERAHLQVFDLEKRLTEFQIVVSSAGDLMGAVGLKIDGKQGLIHSEAMTQPEDEDSFRQLLWERLQIVARNHGLVRLWTQEPAPFWTHRGFQAADAETIQKKLPPGLGDGAKPWLAVQLREESMAAISLEHEFEIFQAAQKQGSDQLMAQAEKLKKVAYILLAIAIVAAAYFLGRILIKNPSIFTGGGGP
jgi:N-acetylglutamate synthase-like GNAT family acetyltransferase